jgi:hypothetical protein
VRIAGRRPLISTPYISARALLAACTLAAAIAAAFIVDPLSWRGSDDDVTHRRAPLTLADIELAVQTEIPLVKQHLCDQLWAARGHGAQAARLNRLTGTQHALPLRPSQATTLAHGFAAISRFFPGMRAELAALDDEIVRTLLGPPVPGKAQLFEDQYISSAGQLYELIAGHDRFIADLRSVARPALVTSTSSLGTAPSLGTVHSALGTSLCCHPYDLCTELIARELGVVVTDESGNRLAAPLNVEADVSWVGYANTALKAVVEPVLLAGMRARGWIA